jgi:hypothetical protein
MDQHMQLHTQLPAADAHVATAETLPTSGSAMQVAPLCHMIWHAYGMQAFDAAKFNSCMQELSRATNVLCVSCAAASLLDNLLALLLHSYDAGLAGCTAKRAWLLCNAFHSRRTHAMLPAPMHCFMLHLAK